MNRIGFFAICLAAAAVQADDKTLKDFFRPMEPRAPLVTEGIWGETNVIPRDVSNGLEDAQLEKWCYWDGGIVKSEAGRYHLYGSRWSQSHSHSRGWKSRSQVIHAVSDHPLGPYEDKGLLWPQWQDGKGHNVRALRMHDGRYAVVSSEITPGVVFVSAAPDGPFELLGEITYDENGFEPALARHDKPPHHMADVQILLRPDGRYMIVPRSCCIMISESGILGPYRIVAGSVYEDIKELPKTRMEDPAVWFSGGIYHMVINHWRSGTAYHLTSFDGIADWQYRGVAYRTGAGMFRYADGTVNEWAVVERPTPFLEGGHVSHFTFSVIDVSKGEEGPHDRNGSKIIVVPFDGRVFDEHMKNLVGGSPAAE